MIRAIIFDLFGVIRPDVIAAAYRQFGGDPDRDRDFIHTAIHAANLGIIPQSRQVIADRLGVSVEEWTDAVMNFKNDPQLLAYIKQLRRHYVTGLLSNISRGTLANLFEPGQLQGLFDAVLASGDVGIGKPDPRFYQMIADKLGVESGECVFIDDREGYCQAASTLGMQAILYTSFAQLQSELEPLLKRKREVT